VYEKAANNPAKFYYIHTDYLGSWLGVTNQQGSLTNHYSYDPWGRPRDPATWKLMPVSITNALADLSAMQPRFDRGYTGHEHMAGFGLINMNGRLYDPYLQRFLSPDDELQDPSNTQNYNRYTYCLNNPLRYTDPTGFDYGDDYPDDSGSGTGSWDGSTDAQLTPREQANWYTPSSSNGGFNNWNNNWGSWNNNSSQTCSLYFFVCRSTEYSTGYTDVYDSFDGTVSTEITYDHSGNVSSLFTWPSQSKTKGEAETNDGKSGNYGLIDTKESSIEISAYVADLEITHSISTTIKEEKINAIIKNGVLSGYEAKIAPLITAKYDKNFVCTGYSINAG
jgi:RHS repeat-associated protein